MLRSYWHSLWFRARVFSKLFRQATEAVDRAMRMATALRKQKKRILAATARTGLQPIRSHSLDWECGTTVMWTLPTV